MPGCSFASPAFGGKILLEQCSVHYRKHEAGSIRCHTVGVAMSKNNYRLNTKRRAGIIGMRCVIKIVPKVGDRYVDDRITVL